MPKPEKNGAASRQQPAETAAAGTGEKRKKKYRGPKLDPEVKADERFKAVRRDPRFRPFRREERKVKVDDRFKAMLTDPRFNLTHKVDPRGRPSAVKSSAENLRKFYAFEDEDDEERAKEDGEDGGAGSGVDEAQETGVKPDYARGEAMLGSSSSEDESSSDEESSAESGDEDAAHPWGELDADAPRTEEDLGATRLAVCSMDWDRVTAKDLLVALSSFLPGAGASLDSVKIYKSEFGKQRMAVEEVSGPTELKDVKPKPKPATKGKRAEDDEEDSEDEATREKVRCYQLARLRYFYAVAQFDKAAAAAHVYDQCDGVEYESSATRFDLRFVPESETFDEADVVDACSRDGLDLAKYEPHLFVNTALQQGKVRCTWDENDPRREKAIDKMFKSLNPKSKKDKKTAKKRGKPVEMIDGLNEEDWRAYMASDSSDDDGEEPEEQEPRKAFDGDSGVGEKENGETEEQAKPKKKKDRLAAYKELLGEIKSKEAKEEKEKAHMEISWHPVDIEPVKQLVEKKKEEVKAETPWDRYLAKLKEKKKQKGKKTPGDEGDPSGELTKEELNDPFFASSNLEDDEEQYDPIKMFKSRDHTSQAEARHQSQDAEDGGGKKKKKSKRGKKGAEDEEEGGGGGDGDGLGLLAMDLDVDEQSKRHFNLDRIVKVEKLKSKKKLYKKDKRKLAEALAEEASKTGGGSGGFEVDVADPRFGAVYSSHEFNVDPSDPLFKPTPGMKAILEEKTKRRRRGEPGHSVAGSEDPTTSPSSRGGVTASAKPSSSSELNSLVQNLKRKAVANDFKSKRGKSFGKK